MKAGLDIGNRRRHRIPTNAVSCHGETGRVAAHAINIERYIYRHVQQRFFRGHRDRWSAFTLTFSLPPTIDLSALRWWKPVGPRSLNITNLFFAKSVRAWPRDHIVDVDR